MYIVYTIYVNWYDHEIETKYIMIFSVHDVGKMTGTSKVHQTKL